MSITERQVLDEYYKRITSEKDEIKKDIKIFFDENQTSDNITGLLIEEFEARIRAFEQSYNMSVPDLVRSPFLHQESFVNTISIYLDLVRYPPELVASLRKSNE